MASAWCGRSELYCLRQASTAACASSMLANGPCTLSSSCCSVWCNRSIFPVVVGDRGLVSRWVMPFSRQIRSNSTSAGRGLPNRPVNCLPLNVAEHFAGDPVLGHRGHERGAHRAGGGPACHGGDDAEPGVVVDPGDDLALAAVGQEQAGRHVHLPQFHRRRPLPPAVLVPAPAPWHRLKQLMADQHPVNRRPGHRMTSLAELEDQPTRTPPAVRAAQVTDHRFHLGADPPRVRLRRMRPVSQAVNPAVPVTRHPPVHRLPGHPEPLSHLRDRDAVQDLKNGTVPLLDHLQLPKHCGSVAHQVKPRCRTSSGAGQRQAGVNATAFSTASRARLRHASAGPQPGRTAGGAKCRAREREVRRG